MALKSDDQSLKDKTANQIDFCCSKRERVPVIIETYLQFTKISLRFVNVKKNSENSFSKS